MSDLRASEASHLGSPLVHRPQALVSNCLKLVNIVALFEIPSNNPDELVRGGVVNKFFRVEKLAYCAMLALAACGGTDNNASPGGAIPVATTPAPALVRPIVSVASTPVATFSSPFAMTFLPDARLLVSEKTNPGALRTVTQTGVKSDPLKGLPANAGILDVKLSPQFAKDSTVYFSFIEAATDGSRVGRNAADSSAPSLGLALGLATLVSDASGNVTLTNAKVIWRQFPKIVAYPGSGEFGGRIAFSPDGKYLFLAAGDRQEFEPVQSLENTLGKIVRLFPDGSIPTDNPFTGRAGARPEIWTLGHRNPYGLTFDAAGRLWSHEMGPKGGDELNIIVAGSNYGWPNVSYGNNYDGGLIPKPAAGDGFAMSALFWDPVIAPAGMIIYSGDLFGAWRGNAIISGLQSNGLVRVKLSAPTATEVERIPLGTRIRDVTQGPDGAIWVLEDGTSARLVRLDPIF